MHINYISLLCWIYSKNSTPAQAVIAGRFCANYLMFNNIAFAILLMYTCVTSQKGLKNSMEIIIIKGSNSIELEHAFSIRKKVFVEEQGVPLEDEFDQFDTLNGTCDHVLAYI